MALYAIWKLIKEISILNAIIFSKYSLNLYYTYSNSKFKEKLKVKNSKIVILYFNYYKYTIDSSYI